MQAEKISPEVLARMRLAAAADNTELLYWVRWQVFRVLKWHLDAGGKAEDLVLDGHQHRWLEWPEETGLENEKCVEAIVAYARLKGKTTSEAFLLFAFDAIFKSLPSTIKATSIA